MHKIKA